MKNTTLQSTFLTTEAFLEHWQGHRRLTRRVIEAFPEDKLFTYSIGGMRPFSELAIEILVMGAPGIHGVVKGKWDAYSELHGNYHQVKTRQELLRLWDEATDKINQYWSEIPAERFHEVDKFFGQYEGTIFSSILYLIDNEIHHRGQGYVYLRSLGIEPPAFWDRN
jgi:uncharacterized damage-inducible protein DinB